MRTLLFILALGLSALTTEASVLVYKGAASPKLPNDISQYGKTPRFYLIVDLANNTAYTIFFFTLDGQKDQKNTFPLSPVRYNSGPLATKTIGTFTFAFDDGGANNNFGVAMIYLRGKETTLPIRNNITGNYPKTLTGFLRSATRFPSGGYNDEINLVLTFDAFHTQAANNAFKDGATATGDLNAELSAKGY